MPEHLGDRVRALREEKGWTQQQLASAADLQVMTVSNVERGKNAQTQTIVAIAEALEVPLLRLFRSDAENEHLRALTPEEARMIADRVWKRLGESDLFREALYEATVFVNRELVEARKKAEQEDKP